jgi:hypothetical protein
MGDSKGRNAGVGGPRVEQGSLNVEGAVSGLVSAGGSTQAERIRLSQRARRASFERAGIEYISFVNVNIGTSSVLVAVRS